MKNFISSATLIIAALLTACHPSEQKKPAASVIDDSAIAVSIAPVKKGNYSLPIVSSGLLSTEDESKLSFKVGGIIASILVDEGQSVNKGQTLAVLDLTEIQAQVSQARNNVEKTLRDLERGQRLYKDSAVTLEQLQNLQTAYNVANEAFTIASFNKLHASIVAPASGKVIRRFANAGEQVSAGVPVFITNTSAANNWIVRIGLADVDWIRVKKGDVASITFDAYPGESFKGEVTLINEGADQVSGLYLVEVSVRVGNHKLASGLFANVNISPSMKQNLSCVPIEAIVEGSGKDAFVFVRHDKGVKKVPVTVAYLLGDSAMITKGLEEISEVIIAGSAFLTEASTIHVTQQ